MTKYLLPQFLALILLLPAAWAHPHHTDAPPFEAELLARAVAEPAPRWKYVRGTRYREYNETFAMQLVALAAAQHPDYRVGDTTLAASLAAKLQGFLRNDGPDAEGNTREPEAQGGIGGWTHGAAAWALLIAKQTPEIWALLTPDDRHRADVLMHALAVGGHFTHGDANDYHVLLDGISWYHKSWNPNHIEGYAGVMMAAGLYFGADDLNDWFTTFDYATFRAELETVGFHNILQTWETTPAMARVLMHGGTYQHKPSRPVGEGLGVRQPFTYRGRTLGEPWAIYLTQADRLWSKAVRSQVNVHGDRVAHMLHDHSDALLSPYEGRMGMIYEFEAMDFKGLRSSLGYAYDCVMIHLGTAGALKVLDLWPDTAEGHDIEQRMAVGMADLIFKAEQGYSGWANGKPSITHLADLKKLGYDYIVGVWQGLFPAPTAPALGTAALGATVLSHETLFADPNVYVGWPDLVRASNGDLLISFCATEEHLSPDGAVWMLRSTDNGETWSEPVVIYDSPLDDRDVGLTAGPDGMVALHVWSTFWTPEMYTRYNTREGYPDAFVDRWLEHVNTAAYRSSGEYEGRWVVTSRDNGHTWGERVRGPESIHGGTVLHNGTWMSAACRKYDNRPSIQTAADPAGPWTEIARIPNPIPESHRMGESHVEQMASGRLVIATRSTAKVYNDQAPSLHFHTAVSDDLGHTWTESQSSQRWGFPPHLLPLSDGRLLASYGYRRPPYGQRASVSSDGLNWTEVPEFILRADAPNEDLGYASSIELSPGEILTVYYQSDARPEGYKRHVVENRVRPSLRATRWLLPAAE